MRWNMKLYKLIIILVILGLTINISQACEQEENNDKCQLTYIHLYEKDPKTWDVVCGDSWGKLKYWTYGEEFDFIFYGYGLTPGENYTLIYYPDPWPGEGLMCLAQVRANCKGKVYIDDSVDTGSLPIESDENEGAKIWLVLSSDVDYESSKMIGWNPSEYLFEEKLIHYTKSMEENSNDKCITETDESETESDESEEESKEDISFTKLFKVLDKLIDRFPIIKKIIQLVVQWIIDNSAELDIL